MVATSTWSSRSCSPATDGFDLEAIRLLRNRAALGFRAGDANLYRYVFNSPTNYTDPSGQEHFPADGRGTWIKGTKGNGVFRYHDTPQNRAAGLANKELVFRNDCIGIGGFPAEFYYGGNAKAAGVRIKKITGADTDSDAADAAMRKKLKDPNWQRPKGYSWNHAGDSTSTTMELIQTAPHTGAAHQGSAAGPRAAARGANANAKLAKGIGVAGVYLNIRDAARMAGVLNNFEVAVDAPYYFVADDGSVFTVEKPRFRSWRRNFVAGPRSGQTEKITCEQAEAHRAEAEAKYGRYESDGLFGTPRFIPGTERKTIEYEEDGVPAGYIDEDGPHEYSWRKHHIA